MRACHIYHCKYRLSGCSGIIAIAGGLIILRCLYIIIHMSTSLEMISFNSVMEKIKNHVKALIILVVIESIIVTIQSYLF